MAARPTPEHPPEFYINRELSWLEFNARVLEEARDRTHPWLERLKFLAIFSANLDEFFEVRVAGLQQQLYAGLEPQDYAADGLGPAEQLAAIDRRTHELVDEQYRVLREEVIPGLAERGIELIAYAELSKAERQHVDALFRSNVFPVLTPLAIDPGHPFPHVHNKSLNVALRIEGMHGGELQRFFAVVQVPAVLDRIVELPRTADHVRCILLEDLIAAHLEELFAGFDVIDRTVFRVTRNTDLIIDEDEADDLLETIEESLRQRIRGEAVRLEISDDADPAFTAMLREALGLEARDVYPVDGSVDLAGLMALCRIEGFQALKDEPLVPRVPQALASGGNMFDLIRAQDILLHHPYESFNAVVEFIERAASDPQVLAIKQTLYRTSAPSPIIDALARAAQNGKQVTALVELKARFDEQNNILWARSLEQAGVHVVYGVVGLKTHGKAALVVRREPDGLRRYVHLSTGNYNPITARIYTDLGLFTADPAIGDDTSDLFNLLTGYAQSSEWRKLVVAPVKMVERVIELIERERHHAETGRPARIVVKMNALVEPSVIDALYRASQSGVAVDLLIRGICCLRPGLEGVSESIRVRSVVDKFLEHSRIFYFENAGDPDVFLGSADWMPRNFFRRIELMFPIEDPRIKQRIVDEVLGTCLADNVKARELMPDGTYVRVVPAPDEPVIRSQVTFQEIARDAGRARVSMPRQFQPILRRRAEGATDAPVRASGG
ncbi:MAG TPA: polyphosphate kinase 1 [Gemmatimonadales bacterium]|nr:polyphosphate kinase 1 [Gemmatimonadales bacterium]